MARRVDMEALMGRLENAHFKYLESGEQHDRDREARDALIVQAHAAGMSMGAIARRLSISDTGVRWVVTRPQVKG